MFWSRSHLDFAFLSVYTLVSILFVTESIQELSIPFIGKLISRKDCLDAICTNFYDSLFSTNVIFQMSVYTVKN